MPEVCGEPHPDQPEVTCEKPRPCYFFHLGSDISWPGPSPDARKGSKRDEVQAMGERARDKREKEALVRNSDPATAHEAIERYEPKRGTAKAKVLGYLRERTGQWVDAPDLTVPEVGGFAGTRRLRELREDGWPIETRPKPGDSNTWQHRLVQA